MTTISLNLSSDAIMREVYAISALHSLQNINNNKTSCPILNRDRQPALRLVVKDAFAFIILKTVPHLTGCNLNNETSTGVADESPDADCIMSIDLSLPDGFPDTAIGSLRHAIENAIAMYTLHLCYLNYDDTLSRRHENLANETIAGISNLIASSRASTPRIIPHY